MPGMRKSLAIAAIAGLVAACASQPSVSPDTGGGAPPEFPEAYYRQAAAERARVLRVDPAASLVVIEVRRGGSLARLGHDHVVASHDVQGYVAPDAGRADLYVRLDQLVVDEPALRIEAKLDTQPTADEVAGTRRNMLNTLEVARHPYALVSVAGRVGGRGETAMRVAVTLHGVTRALQVPVRVDVGADAIEVSGRLTLKQTDFGITPMSVLGGAIQVQDPVELRFRVRARPMPRQPAGALSRPRSPDAAITPRSRPPDPA
jgi:polyisoprenoid-binding protein YceI